MHSFGKYFGLGEKTNIDIPSERSGLWPSRAWKRLVKGLPWYPGNSLNMSIGQGDVLVTPLQLASMTSTIARKGTFIEPRIVNTIGRDTTVYTNDTIIRSVYNGEDKNWTLLFKSMVDTVHNRRGTAYSISEGLDFKIAGKTGTAQVVGIGQDKEYDSDGLSERNRDHALFIGFAPAENPTIAVAVIIENGEKSSQAALVAREVMKTYLYKQKNKKVTNKQELSYAR